MKYIVTWFLVTYHTIAVHDTARFDEFNRPRKPTISWRNVEDRSPKHSKTFSNRDSAQAFYNRAYNDIITWTEGWMIEDVKLDSIATK